MNDTVITGGTSPLVTTRVAAMVSASVFDAVNGIERRYQPQFVRPNAQHPASQRAAALTRFCCMCTRHRARISRRI